MGYKSLPFGVVVHVWAYFRSLLQCCRHSPTNEKSALIGCIVADTIP